MTDQTPQRIDRAALDRIIQRAAELQTSEREIGEGLTPDEVLALGREVGIPARHLQRALVEERSRVALESPTGWLDRVAGPGAVTAQRVVQGEPDDVERELLHWIEAHELLCIQRQQRGWVTWEPLSPFQAMVRRSTAAVGPTRRPFLLAGAETVTTTFTALESGYTHVALSAQVRNIRSQYAGGAAAIASVGIAASAVLVTLGAMLPVALAVLPGALGLSYGIVRLYRPKALRVQLGLERALDHLEQRSTRAPAALPPAGGGLFDLIATEVRKAIASKTGRPGGADEPGGAEGAARERRR